MQLFHLHGHPVSTIVKPWSSFAPASRKGVKKLRDGTAGTLFGMLTRPHLVHWLVPLAILALPTPRAQ